MELRHIAVTQKQFNQTWDQLPPHMRYTCDDSEPRCEAGFICFPLNDKLLLWVDYLMPESQWSEEVDAELVIIRALPSPPMVDPGRPLKDEDFYQPPNWKPSRTERSA